MNEVSLDWLQNRKNDLTELEKEKVLLLQQTLQEIELLRYVISKVEKDIKNLPQKEI